jgi:hypothetical protein
MLQAIHRGIFGDSYARPAASATADTKKRVVAAILKLRGLVKSGSAAQIEAAIRVSKSRAAADDFEPRELSQVVADAQHMLAVLAYSDRLARGEGVQTMAVMSDGEPAYFRTGRASRETARADDGGRLDVGDKGIFYDGTKRLTIVWDTVLTIGVDRESLIIHPTDGGTPHIFYLENEREALLAHAVTSAILKRQAQSTAPSATSRPDQQSRVILDIGSADSYCHFKIVGESHYQDRLRSIASSGRSFTVVMMPEPTNAFDPNAIRVVAEVADTIGYFSREDAASYAPVFKMLARHDCAGTCRARLTGGPDEKRSFAVRLNLRDASDLLISLRNALEPGSPVDANAEAF